MGNLPLRSVQFSRRTQPKLVAGDSRCRVCVRVLGHLRPPVPGNGPAVQLRSAYLSVYVRRHFPVMLRAEGSWLFDLHRLRGRKGLVKAGTLPRQRLVALIGLIWDEDRLRLAVRSKCDRLGRRPLAPKPGKDARQSRPDLRQGVYLDYRRIDHADSVPKFAHNCVTCCRRSGTAIEDAARFSPTTWVKPVAPAHARPEPSCLGQQLTAVTLLLHRGLDHNRPSHSARPALSRHSQGVTLPRRRALGARLARP